MRNRSNCGSQPIRGECRCRHLAVCRRCAKPKLDESNVAMALNAKRAQSKAAKGSCRLVLVHLRCSLWLQQKPRATDAWPESDDAALSEPRNVVVSVGGPDFDSNHPPSSEFMSPAKEGLEILASLRTYRWIVESVPLPVQTGRPTAVVLRVTLIQQNEDANRTASQAAAATRCGDRPLMPRSE